MWAETFLRAGIYKPQTFSQWEAQYPTLTDKSPTGTPQNDGIPTLFKYLCNIDPTRPMSSNDRAALPNLKADASIATQKLTLTYRQYALLTGTTVSVQTSSDLQTWTTLSNPTIVPAGVDPNTGEPLMQVQVPFSGDKLFIRLYVGY